MDEVDRIIVHSLKQIECDIDDGVTCLAQFTTELIVEAVVKCLRLIRPGFETSHHLPPGMTTRFRIGSALAQACVDLGYSGDIGYQTFLYWSETDVRRVLMFLIEKLPKETEKASDELLGASMILKRKISSEIRRRLQLPWLPAHFPRPHLMLNEDVKEAVSFKSLPLVNPSHLEDVMILLQKETKAYYDRFLDVVTDQPTSHDAVMSCLVAHNAFELARIQDLELELNKDSRGSKKEDHRLQKKMRIDQRMKSIVSKEMQKSSSDRIGSFVPNLEGVSGNSLSTKDSRFMLTEKLIYTKGEDGSTLPIGGLVSAHPGESKEALKERRQQEEETLGSQIRGVDEKLSDLSFQTKKLSGGINQLREQLAMQQQANQELSKVYKLKKTTFDLLPEADTNLSKLQSVVEATAQRLVNLATQWENHRAPIVEQYRQLRELNANRVSETQRKLEEIVGLREKMKEISEEARTKDEIHKQLTAEYEKMTRDLNRSVYTRRILEIVTNIKKQTQDIDKVLVDTKEVQKEINQLSGKLERTFTVTDELIFKDAKKDNAVRKAYKYLAALHDNCCQLVKTVEETGIIMREIRDLEDQIENESQRKVLANLGRIMADYQQMKQENNALLTKLTSKPAE